MWLLLSPRALAAVGIPADNSEARSEIRAMYGGLELGIAAFLCLCITRDEWVQPALLLQMLALGGLAAARWIGIVVERGRVRKLIWFFALLESAAAVLTWWVLSRRF